LSEELTNQWRADFPLFTAHPELAYMDQGATGQYPQPVIDAMMNFATTGNAPVHRGLYRLAYDATSAFEGVRQQVADFIGARTADEIVFTSGTTAAINLVAQSFGQLFVDQGSEVLVSVAEHHSNFLPWQRLCEQTGAKLVVAPITADGAIDEQWVLAHINVHTRIVALAQETNVSGARLQDARAIADRVHANSGYLLLDGAQALAHQAVDVQALGCDFYAFSGHKIYGPSGTGCLYGRQELLTEMPPVTLGGGMIEEVSIRGASWLPAPERFEAGSQNVLGVIGLGAAIDYLQPRRAAISNYCSALTQRLRQQLAAIPGVQLYSSQTACATLSFNLDGVHAHDLATFLDEQNIAVRAGHHCAQPLMQALDVPAVVRATLGAYSSVRDGERLVAAVLQARAFFGGESHGA
jgi:cysteine desulfurase/selenocysteine lyase